MVEAPATHYNSQELQFAQQKRHLSRWNIVNMNIAYNTEVILLKEWEEAAASMHNDSSVTKGAVPNCCLGIVWDFLDLWPSTASSQLHPVTPTHSPLVIQIRFWSSSDHEQKLNIPPKLWLRMCEIIKKVLVKVWKSWKYLKNIALPQNSVEEEEWVMSHRTQTK